MSDLVGLGVVIVNYHSAALVQEMVAAQPWMKDCAVVVIDNSQDAVETTRLGRATESLTDVVVAGSAGNPGFGAGVNLGVRILAERGCSTALLINPDARIDRLSVETLCQEVGRCPDALVAPVIHDGVGAVWFAGGALDWAHGWATHHPSRRDWLTAACLLAPIGPFLDLGGFDDAYFLYWEDVDLSRRWVLAGGSLKVCTGARATHLVGATQGSSPGKSLTYVRYSCRNRLRFAARHCTPAQRVAWLTRSPSYARTMVGRRHAAGWWEPVRSWLAALAGSAAGATRLALGSGARTERAGA